MGMWQAMRDWFGSPAAVMDNRADYLPAELRAAVGPVLFAPHQLNRPIWTTGDPARYVSEGFTKAPVVFACVIALADAAATASIVVKQDSGNGQLENAEDSELQLLLNRPNPGMDQAEFMSQVVVNAATSGFCVIEKERNGFDEVIGLWPLRSDWLRPIPRSQSAPAWEYRIPGHREPFVKEPEDVIVHTHAPDPNLGYRGTAPLAVAFRELGIENAMTDFLKAFFDRGALPVYGVIPKQAITDQAQADAFRERLMGKYGGALKSAEPLLLTGVEDVKRLGFNFDELAYPELRALSEVQICTAFRVPPILIGIQAGLDAGTYSNYEQARRAFYEDAVSSIWRRIDGALTRGLVPEFDGSGRLSIEFDTGEVAALQDDENDKWSRHNAAVSAGWATPNDARRAVGLPPLNGGDVLYVPFAVNVTPVSEQRARAGATIEAQGGEGRALPEPRIVTRDGRQYLNERALPASEREQRARIAETHRDAILRLADVAEPVVSAYLAAQRDRVVEAVTGERADGTKLELRAIESIDWDAERDELLRVLQGWLDTVGETAFGLAATELSLDGSMWRVSNAYLRELVDLLGRRIVGITETTRRDVERVVVDALAEGTSMPDLAKKLKGLYSETYNGRSMTLARTESQVAFNTASVMSYEASGVVSRALLHDNASHTESYGASDGLTCAQRNNLIVPLASVSRHIAGEHPNGQLACSPYVEPVEGA